MDSKPRNVREIVEAQVMKWQAEERAARLRPPPRFPVITISREYGARGAALGGAICARVGFQLWDQELVHAIARETGASESLLRSVDEHARGALEDLIDGVLFGVAYTEAEYLRQLFRIVHTISNHGKAVIVGRGSNFILREVAALRLRVICPLAIRIQRLIESRGSSEREAKREIERVDGERAAFIRHHFKRDVADPAAYDLMINMGTLRPEGGVEVALTAYRAKFGIDLPWVEIGADGVRAGR